MHHAASDAGTPERLTHFEGVHYFVGRQPIISLSFKIVMLQDNGYVFY